MTLTLNKNLINTNKSTVINKLEIQLLLCCARIKIDAATSDRIKDLVQQNIDWQYLISLSAKHGVLPLLFSSLNRFGSNAVPENIMTGLRNFFQANAKRNLLFAAELLNILNVFEANNINAIPFKGVALAASAYDNLAYRHFGDLDILIDKKNVKQATKKLIEKGYKAPKQLTKASEKPYLQNDIFLESEKYQSAFEFTHQAKGIAVELHWSLTTKAVPLPLKYDYLWKNRLNIAIADKQIAQFDTETLLIYLCFHASKHHWSELKWVCDVSEFIQAHPQLDWEIVNQKAKKWGCNRIVNMGLLLVHNLLNLALPESILLKINRDPVAKQLVNQVIDSIFTRDFTHMEEHIFIIKSRERLQDQIHCLSHFVFAPTAKDWKFLPFTLPKSLSFLYRLIRPYRLVKEYFIALRI